MPHSSGGGSHGGGSHGGSSGRSSTRISSHYFPGSRRYLRHYSSTGKDEYFYSNSKPQKTTRGSVICVAVIAVFSVLASILGIASSAPRKLKEKYTDAPAIHDNICVIGNEDELLKTLNEYQELTGICSVIYTVRYEDWYEHPSIESYALNTYTDNFSDEQHWVFVYAIPEDQIEGYQNGNIRVPDFSWEAIQGDETDPIITESMFTDFRVLLQEELENGTDVGKALNDSFELALSDAHKKLDSGALRSISLAGSFMPVLFIGGMFVPFLIIMIRQYKKDKDVEYTEVPLDVEPVSVFSALKGDAQIGVPVKKAKATYHDTGSSTDTALDRKAQLMGFVFMIPFVAVGIGMIIAGAAMASKGNDDGFGVALLMFGLVWTVIIVAMLITSSVKIGRKNKKTEDVPLTSEYPKAEYPDAKYPDISGADPIPVKPVMPEKSQEFDPKFFSSSKSDYDDDEDFKRKKRQGYE